MLNRFPFLVFAWAVLSLAPAGAQTAVSSAASGADSRDPGVWLSRIHEAANRRNYQGTVVVSAGGTLASSRITHFCEGKDQFERIDSLDGQMRHVYRHNDVVHTVWPQSRLAMVEHREDVNSFPAFQQKGAERISDFYEVKQIAGPERVAGRDAQVVAVKPRDSHRYGHRLWVDTASGLLLRTEVLNERNEVLESSAFSDVSIGVKSQVDQVVQPLKKLDGYRVLRPSLEPATLESEGWMMKSPVPGFTIISCTKRVTDAVLPVSTSPSPARMLQTIYSDGVTYVSIFIEPFNADRHPQAIATAIGATQTFMQRHGEWWVTLMGDVPASTLRQFARGLERKK